MELLKKIIFSYILLVLMSTKVLAAVDLEQQSVGEVEYLYGQAAIVRAETTLNATQGFKVFEGDKIMTQQASRIRIRFMDGSAMQMGENAQSMIKKYEVKEGGMFDVFLELIQGRARFMIMKLKEIDASYQVKLRSVLIGVRGTDILAQTGVEEHIALIHGRIALSDQLGGTLTLEPDFYVNSSKHLPTQAEAIPLLWLERFIQDVGTSDETNKKKKTNMNDDENAPAEALRSKTIQGLKSPVIIPRGKCNNC